MAAETPTEPVFIEGTDFSVGTIYDVTYRTYHLRQGPRQKSRRLKAVSGYTTTTALRGEERYIRFVPVRGYSLSLALGDIIVATPRKGWK